MIRGDWVATPRQFYTANSSVPRWAYLEAGLFDPLFRRAEDVELAYRLRDAGLQFHFRPDAVIHHRPKRGLKSWKSIGWQYGFYDVLMWRFKNRGHILSLIAHEFRYKRPRSLQLMARVLVGRRAALSASVTAAGLVASCLSFIRAEAASHSLYSVMFNLLYWQGVADGLGNEQGGFSGVIKTRG
jgi:GT2 family glycosyltransferase